VQWVTSTTRYADALINTMNGAVKSLLAQTASMPDVAAAEKQLSTIEELLEHMPGPVGPQARQDIEKERQDIAKRVELQQRELKLEQDQEQIGKLRERMVWQWNNHWITEAWRTKQVIEQMVKQSMAKCERELAAAGPTAALTLMLTGCVFLFLWRRWGG
jgi:galactokinase